MSTATLPAPSPSDFAARLPALGPRLWPAKRVYLRYPKPYEGGAGGGDLGWVDFTGELPRFVGKAPADLRTDLARRAYFGIGAARGRGSDTADGPFEYRAAQPAGAEAPGGPAGRNQQPQQPLHLARCAPAHV